jgi:hypothetical protein
MFDILEVRKETVRVGLCRYTNLQGELMHKMYLTARIARKDGKTFVTTPPDLFIQRSLHSVLISAVKAAWEAAYGTV